MDPGVVARRRRAVVVATTAAYLRHAVVRDALCTQCAPTLRAGAHNVFCTLTSRRLVQLTYVDCESLNRVTIIQGGFNDSLKKVAIKIRLKMGLF